MLKKHLLSIFTSRWLILAESLLVLLQTILAFTLAPLVLLFSPFEWFPLIVILLGVYGLLSLWRYFLSIKYHRLPPLWATIGLGVGLLASIGLFYVLDTSNWHVQLAQLLMPLIAVHWYCLKKFGVQVDFGKTER